MCCRNLPSPIRDRSQPRRIPRPGPARGWPGRWRRRLTTGQRSDWRELSRSADRSSPVCLRGELTGSRLVSATAPVGTDSPLRTLVDPQVVPPPIARGGTIARHERARILTSCRDDRAGGDGMWWWRDRRRGGARSLADGGGADHDARGLEWRARRTWETPQTQGRSRLRAHSVPKCSRPRRAPVWGDLGPNAWRTRTWRRLTVHFSPTRRSRRPHG